MAETVISTPPAVEAKASNGGGDDRGENCVGFSGNQLAGAPPCDPAVKRRRGRPPAVASAVSKRSKKVDEDVCFICFDGGSLVLCDHRDCPKAYHPACVKRDESYFVPDIRWDCGWHFCNICQKSALFMCYTCPYSLCKGCVKQADILCVRGNKGFCRTCMSTVMLLEKMPLENKESAPVDFDDTTSWEYLFKVYWMFLKEKEALTLDELIRASNPWKVVELKNKATFQQKARDTNFSNSYPHPEANTSKRRMIGQQQQQLIMDSKNAAKATSDEVSGLLGQPDWATKELLKFVAYVKNGDMSFLSEFDVQTLLLDYIKNHNLRDPRQKCQIICDKRLENLFGKERVGHFEMLRLLEHHFRKESSTSNVIHGAAMNPVSGETKEGITADHQISCRDIRRQNRKKKDDKGRLNNLDAYAAIDAHNINLIYLKRGLLETLMMDAEKFHDKVVGSIVRIKLSSNDQKQDMHRLVRIIGTSKATNVYKIGAQMGNLMLKILNLNKVEDVRIDAISDLEFSEDECKRLRQSIKLGLVERMTVGEIQEKAMALQEMRFSNWLETEITRLNHLRDQASEKGHLKRHRDLVEKIELLRTSEERQHRIQSIPEVHADSRMDPSYGSDDSGEADMKRRDGPLPPKYSNSYSIRKELTSHARILKAAAANGECKKGESKNIDAGKVEGALGSLKPSRKTETDSRTDSSVVSDNHGVAAICSSSQACSGPSQATSGGVSVVSDISELEKIWNYQDPSGKVQGPFCIFQLRKWSTNGCFPDDLKVWRSIETCSQSVLLSDALKMQRSGAKIDDEEVHSIEIMNSNSVASGMSNQANDECSKSNLTNKVCTPETVEQSMNDHSFRPDSEGLGGRDQSTAQFAKAQLIESLFNIEEPCSDSTVEGSPEMTHVNIKSESHRLSNGTKSEDAENYHDRVDKHCAVNRREQSSGVESIVSAQKVDNGGMKCEDAESIRSVSLNLPQGGPSTRWSTISCGTDVSLLPSSMLNKSEIKANIALNVPELECISTPSTSLNPETDGLNAPITESQNIVTSDIPGQDSGITWNNIFGGELHLPDAAGEWNWQPIELNTLGDDSVSDLLSEVEAMESLRGMLSPTSRANCANNSAAYLGDDCFSPLGGLSLNLDLRINDSLNTTGDIHAHHQHYNT